MENPFRPTFGVSPAILAGRSRPIEDFRIGLVEGTGSPFRSILVSGARGMGKTVLLNEFEDAAAQLGWVTVRAYPSETMISEMVETTLPNTIAQVSDTPPKRMVMGISVAPIGSVSLGANPQFHTATPTLITQLRALDAALQPESGILITLDELQHASADQLHALGTAVQDLKRDNINIAFAAAGLSYGIDTLLQNPGTTFLRRAVRIDLRAVPRDDAAAMFRDTARLGSLDMTTDAVELAADFSRGYPYLMQALGSLAWARTRLNEASSISADAIESSMPGVLSRFGNQVHRPSLHDATDQELKVLYAMAELIKDLPSDTAGYDAAGAVPTRDIARRLGVAPNGISMARRNLINREIVTVPEYGKLAFALPYLGEYLLNNPEFRPLS